MPLFQSSVFNKYLKDQDVSLVNEAYSRFTAYFHNPTIQQNIRESKEEQFQEGFLTELFVKVLGYVINPNPDYNLTTEFKNQTGAKKADGAILKDGVAIGVIELKSTKTKDLEAVRQQAFDYKANQANCTYVVTSNFEKLRFYINNAVDYEEFDLFRLTFERFRILHLCLSDQEILKDIPLHIKEESVLKDEQITKKLYADYSVFKRELYDDLITRNMDDPLFEGQDEKEIKKTLFQKSQKLLDRFLFIFFAEDRGLLPPNSTTRILTQWTQLKDLDAYVPLYDRFKKYFGYLNTGFKGKEHDIYAYNGGLFKPDEILDSLLIDDDMLFKHTSGLTRYNFETEVDVNILGHIFENSLNEIETVNAEIEGVAFEKQTSKRKKDGVFYTPKYITKYIVDNTVGRLCQEKKEELGIVEEDYLKSRKGRKKETLKVLDDKLKTYRDWLLQITICDPACGSGAFLNQALNFLIEEHHYIDQLSSALLDLPMIFRDVENSILENNIYGVDLNDESVEIARLSLWLRTAQKGRKLTTLSGNIKCGNSLIDDPTVAGDKAFNWKEEFPKIFKNGGFDVVIGNPPYGADLKQQTEFLKNKFSTFSLSGESYILFIEKALDLLRIEGRLGFIVPDTYLNLDFSNSLRSHLLKNSLIEQIVLLPAKVFESATVDTTNLILQKREAISTFYNTNVQIKLVNKKSNSIEKDGYTKELEISTEVWNNENAFLIQSSIDEINLIQKIDRQYSRLGEFSDMYSGIKCYEIGKGIPKQTKEIRAKKPFTSNIKESDRWEPFFEGKHIERYQLLWDNNSWIDYGEWLAAPRDSSNFEDEKILIRKIVGKTLLCQYVHFTSYCNTLLFILKLNKNARASYKSLLGVLNSNFIGWYFRNKFQISDSDTFPQIMIRDILKFPVPNKNSKDIELNIEKLIKKNSDLIFVRNRFINRVKSNLNLKDITLKLFSFHLLSFQSFLKELKKINVTLTLDMQDEWDDYFTKHKEEIASHQYEISRIEKEIDQMVYELYGLSEEEIKLVEGDYV